MKLFLVASVSALLTTVLSASIPKEDIISLDTEILSSEAPMMISWPESANPNRRTSSYGPSNAERMQRGLPLAAPRAAADSAIKKRLVNGPGFASSPATSGKPQQTYAPSTCTDSYTPGSGSAIYLITFTSYQDLADQCATLQSGLPSSAGSQFAIQDDSANRGPGNGFCIVSVVTPGEPRQCTASNIAIYYPFFR